MTSGLTGETYEDRLIEVGLTSLEARRLRRDLTQTWIILHGYDNVEESSWFSRTFNTANRLTRQSNCRFNLNVKQFNSNIRKNSFSLRLIKLRNSLPDYIEESKSLNIFKNSYDEHVKNVENLL